jgi:hypothetical protein
MPITLRLKSPLFTSWTEQYVHLTLPGVAPGDPMAMRLDGARAEFQYTGEAVPDGARIVARLGFDIGQERVLEFTPAARTAARLAPRAVPLDRSARIGAPRCRLAIACPAVMSGGVRGPFASIAGRPMGSLIRCAGPFQGADLRCTNEGPLFTDYVLCYRFDEGRRYTLGLRCYAHESIVEVTEQFSLGMDAAWEWTLNPRGAFDSVLSHSGPEFEGEGQPVVTPVGQAGPADVLCRLQMPVLSEYFIPRHRGWFAFFDSRREERGMLGMLGLYGARWEEPAANVVEVRGAGGRVAWRAPLAGGRRYWLLYAGPVEKAHTPERRLVFHRLHAEFNALRLDEHLDLTGDGVFDASCWKEDGFFVGQDFHEQARRRYEAFPCLPRMTAQPHPWMVMKGQMHQAILDCLIRPTPEHRRAICDHLLRRFELWVRQFQGWRRGSADYEKNTIGFARHLRGMLMGYELLRKDGGLTPEQIGRLNAYFVFAARRIMDEGRWPFSRTWRHPDHPESTRDFYTYGGEHRPDRLVWTNCLPNFQSDPMCALAHLSALFKDHPAARTWQRLATDEFERQLSAYCGKSGAWEESINYALYTFSYFVITFRALKHRWGVDYFNDERVRRFAGWLCRYLGPRDRRFDAPTWPGVGNAVLPQPMGEALISYAGELSPDDPLRSDCIAVFQLLADYLVLSEHNGTALAAMAPLPERAYTLRPAGSEVMDEVGVSLRHNHLQPDESYLFQKIGFAKDHYESDETSFNWYAKGTPFCMDYGTYTADVGGGDAHNLVEIPDLDPLRRGYLADHLFTPAVDYTRCEIPVTLKLLWGRVRSFEELDSNAREHDRRTPPYFYIGDRNPVGPKCWKVRLLLFVKPDYVALFDRVYGQVPHRYNLHFTGEDLRREGARIAGRGRFDLDLLCLVQHPAAFDLETGELVPNFNPAGKPDEKLKHRQSYFRLYNRRDGIYRTLVFARERERAVTLEALDGAGMKVVTPEFTDYVFLHDDSVETVTPEVRFRGACGWIRRSRDGGVMACVPDGESMEAFGLRIEGRGPWTYNVEGRGQAVLKGGAPRRVTVGTAKLGRRDEAIPTTIVQHLSTETTALPENGT